MSCDVGEVMEMLENEQSSCYVPETGYKSVNACNLQDTWVTR